MSAVGTGVTREGNDRQWRLTQITKKVVGEYTSTSGDLVSLSMKHDNTGGSEIVVASYRDTDFINLSSLLRVFVKDR